MELLVDNRALSLLRKAIRCLLRPVVKIALQQGMPFQIFMEDVKRVFIEVAEDEFALTKRKQSAARVAIVTGISRKEISRYHKQDKQAGEMEMPPVNRAVRVISAWIHDPEFQDALGRPLQLSVEGEGPSFTALVRKSSGDMLVRAMLDELIRVGSVELVGKEVRLVNRSYIPSKSDAEKFRILGVDVARLVETISHNIQEQQREPYFQRKVYYDNLPEQALHEIRALCREHGQQLLELLDKKIQHYDRDVNPNSKGDGQFTAGMGIYYFEHDSIKDSR